MDPEEESVEESLDDSSLEDSPGPLPFLGGWFGGALGFLLGGALGFGFGFGCCLGGWAGVRGLELHGRCTRGRRGGPLRPLVGSGAALGTGRQCCPTPQCASRERCRGLPHSPSWP